VDSHRKPDDEFSLVIDEFINHVAWRHSRNRTTEIEPCFLLISWARDLL